MLFGVYPSKNIKKTVAVKPALTWKSLVVYFKVIKAGNAVGYGLTWKPDHNIRAVTVPVGYGDGYFRSMSHKAKVLLNGKLYPVVGNISMDQIVVNIENDSAYNSDEVILLGSDGKNSITAEDLAEWAGTIPYEILTNINTRVPRIYLRINLKLLVIPVKRSAEPDIKFKCWISAVSQRDACEITCHDICLTFPITTVHGLISHFAINPFLTYGSFLTKSSITDLSATRKINNALSGGSLKAPARINSFF